MNYSENIRRIRDAAASITPPAGLESITSRNPGVGQVWRTHAVPPFPEGLPPSCWNEEPFPVIILQDDVEKLNGHPVMLAVPVHYDVAMAGPDDVILPAGLFGGRTVACAGASVPVLKDSLDVCIGVLPVEWAEKLLRYHSWLNGEDSERPEVVTGIDYLDQDDLRWKFKEQLGDQLAYLQQPFLAWAEQCGALDTEEQEASTGLVSLLDFFADFFRPVPEPTLALAAASAVSAERPLKSRYLESADGHIVIRVSEAEKVGYMVLEVVTDAHNRLDGAEVRDANGKVISVIQSGSSCFAAPDGLCFAIAPAGTVDAVAFRLLPEAEKDSRHDSAD